MCLLTGQAKADRISELSKQLKTAKSHKARVAAVASLGRLRDQRTLAPLVKALRDKNNTVRSVAASALGRLGDTRALPPLRRAALDKDSSVRKRATKAIALIRKKTGAAGPRSTYNSGSRRILKAHYRGGGRESPRHAPRTPQLYVIVRTTVDKSKGKVHKSVRKARATAMRSLLLAELGNTKRLTTNTSLAEELELPHFAVDISITRLRRVVRGSWVELECELRLAISNERGKMISFLTGGAKVQVPKRSFRRQYEPNMRKEALENAVKSVHGDLVTYLVKTSGV